MNTFTIEAEEERISLTIQTLDTGIWITVNESISVRVCTVGGRVSADIYPRNHEAGPPLGYIDVDAAALPSDNTKQQHPF